MSPEVWQRVKKLFHRALELEPAAREALLASLSDPEAAQVRALLAAEVDSRGAERIEGAIESVAVMAGAEGERGGDELRGRRMGPYRVLEELGRGGLATVYLAERADEQFQMRVAIKVVRRGLDSEDLLERLRQERQILARLDHPNIARLLDGGSTEDGQPYVVMEHIDGEPLDRWCESCELSLAERIALFRQVAAAVDYAHRNLVIHRDIKPSNILVTREGTPKLLDFGIAKLLDPEEHPGSLAETAAGVRLLSPRYASPEQVRGEPLTTATDIYSLGVLLYRLLSGHPPYRLPSARQVDLERVICRREVELPSARVRRLGSAEAVAERAAAGKALAAGRGGDEAERLARRLEGDLDNIVAKALRKEPARRYASAAQLAEDLERHVLGLPVSARPDTLGYRLGKFAGRHRLGLAAACLTFLLLAALVTFYTLRLKEERDRAQLEAGISDAVVSLLTNLNPAETGGELGTASLRLVEKAAADLDELVDDPRVVAAVAFEIGDLFRAHQDWERAEELYARSLEIRRRTLSARDPALAESLNAVGHMQYLQVRSRDRPEKLAAAEANLRAAYALRMEVLGSDDPETWTSMTNLAVLEMNQGRLEAAERLLRAVIDRRTLVLGSWDPEVADSLHSLGAVLRRMERYDEALETYRRGLEIYRRHHGWHHQATANMLANLANAHLSRGDLEAAAEGFGRAREIFVRLLGEDHPDVVRLSARLAEAESAAGGREESLAH